jgi:hypothetical protein
MMVEVNEMFTYVKMKNFMSFKEATFDFKNGSKCAKKFIAIYGENGSGKSNFVMGIDFLRKSIDSFQMVMKTEKIMEVVKEKEIPQDFLDILLNNTNIQKYKDYCRMIECDEPTTIEYGFEINGHEGYYIISFAERFIYEKLYYFTGKQRGAIFELDYTKGSMKISFSNKLFKEKKVEEELKDEINKYWGKHTLLSIFNREREEKNEEYIAKSYLGYVYDIIDMLKDTTIHCKKTSYSGSEISAGKPTNMLKDLKEGKIKRQNEELLDRSERIVRDFLTQAYADIKDVYYERQLENDIIAYRLYVRKMIGGKIRTIDFSRESAGTQHILEIIRSLLGAFCGVTVVYDEIDDGIHDLLLKNVLESMIDDITGQLIITTHNTYMLETIDIKSVYLINVDYHGNKEVKCLDKYPRIQGTNNPRIMYLKGLFGGVPLVDVVDYDLILQELGEGLDVEGGE